MLDPRMANIGSLPLDRTDIRLLSAIQEDASLTNVELGERIHLSPSQCARRLDRLRREGYIDRVVTLLDPARFGFTILVHTAISLRTHENDRNRAFMAFVQDSPEVLECYSHTGDSDFIMKIIVGSLDDLSAFFDRMLHVTGGVASMRSGVVMKTIKHTTAIPLAR